MLCPTPAPVADAAGRPIVGKRAAGDRDAIVAEDQMPEERLSAGQLSTRRATRSYASHCLRLTLSLHTSLRGLRRLPCGA
jgi:hypothetical protein